MTRSSGVTTLRQTGHALVFVGRSTSPLSRRGAASHPGPTRESPWCDAPVRMRPWGLMEIRGLALMGAVAIEEVFLDPVTDDVIAYALSDDTLILIEWRG
jgi:hypothetical protein